MTTIKRSILPFAAALALGCSGNDERSVVVAINDIEVPPGTEVQNCYYLKASNTEPIDIGHVAVDFSKGTHHAHIYYGDTPHEDGVEECFTSVDFDKWHLLIASHEEKLDWELPQGVALRLQPHQQLLVQVHYVNAGMLTTDGNRGSGTFRLDIRPPSEVRAYMGTVFGQQRAIDIPPHSTFSVEGLCKLPREVDVAAYAGHYHFRGTAHVAHKTDLSGRHGEEFYRTTVFADPEFDIYPDDAPIHFTPSEQIMWRCEYDNPTPLPIPFGPREVDQEHCNMFVFYHPAAAPQEFSPCVSWERCPAPCAEGEVCNEAGACVAR